MFLVFKYGFTFEGFEYGWHKKELYRLPSTINNRTYGFKKLEEIKIGCQYGYRIKRNKFTTKQLLGKTAFISREIQVLKDESDLPIIHKT